MIKEKERKMLIKSISYLFTLVTFALACKPASESGLRHLVSKDLDVRSVNEALKSDIALQINLKTNRLSYYKGGKVIDQWNVASADITGEFHKVNGENQKQETPIGIYTAHDIEHCPSWIPRNPIDPKTGEVVEDPEKRLQIFEENQSMYGPCGETNPLGSYALWFSGAYGVHGNSAEWVLDLPVEDRRVSGGCIRNPNNKIQLVFNDILKFLPTFEKKVKDNLKAAKENKKTVTAYSIMNKTLVHIVVGEWGTDPNVGDIVGDGKLPMSCRVAYVSPVSGVLEIFENNPLSNPIGSYDKDEIIQILEEDRGVYRTKEGFINKNFLSECMPINTPSSMPEASEVERPSSNNDTPSSSEDSLVDSGSTPGSNENEKEVSENVEEETKNGDPSPSTPTPISSGESSTNYIKKCKVLYADRDDNLLIFGKVPLKNVVGQYKKGDTVDIIEKVATIGNIYKTDKGFINANYMGQCQDY